MLAPREDGSYPKIGGFILIGFPQTELHLAKLREHHFEFDKVIYLNDPSEEDAGKEVKERMVENMHYDWEVEAEKATKIRATIDANLNGDETPAENIIDINATGSIEDVGHKITTELDPFQLRVDNYTLERTEDQKPMPFGEFGDYCPVTYVKDNWLAKGVPENPDLECSVFGKIYRFSGEKEIEQFKFNPAKFLVGHEGPASLPLLPPAPKIMIIGQKGKYPS